MATLEGNKVELAQVVSRDPEVHSGDLVFAGTRVPVETLVAYLIKSSSIEEFLMDFPTVERWRVESFLEYAPEALDHLRADSATTA